MRKSNLYYLTISAMFTALIAVGAFIKVPMPLLPFTMQTFFTMLACFLLPKKYSSLSAVLYLILGLIGVPIFTSGGGLGYVLTPGFGYLIGFVVANYVAGGLFNSYCSKKMPLKMVDFFRFGIVNISIVYICGLFYWYLLANIFMSNSIGLWPLIMNGFLLTLPGDIVKLAVAVPVALKLRKYL
ncbi:MAG: biotin transporter BioY [Christensenellales bacterium]